MSTHPNPRAGQTASLNDVPGLAAVVNTATDHFAIAQQHETAAQRAVRFANAFTIESAEDYENACAELVAIKQRAKAVEEAERTITRPQLEALDAARSLFRAPKATFASVEGIWKQKLLVWQQRQAAIAEAARKVAEEAAQKERARLAQLAEQQAAAGKADEAQATLAEAEVTVAQPIAQPPPSGRGVSTAKSIDFAVADKLALVRFFVEQHEHGLLDYVIVDMVRLRRAVATHGANLKWPGLTIGEKSTVRVRTP